MNGSINLENRAQVLKKKNKENKRILIVNFKNTSTHNIFESTIRIEGGIIFRIFNLTWIRKCSCHQSTNGLNYSRSPADDSRDNPPLSLPSSCI